MKRLAACTCVAANYLSFARVLVESFRGFHPEIPFYVVVGDRREPGGLLRAGGATPLRLSDLKVEGLRRMLQRYERKQVMVAMKPAVLRHLLERGHEAAVFLDPDMLVTATLEPVLETVLEHALTLSPHVGPKIVAADDPARERTLLYAGMYNGGFVGVTNREETLRFLGWWEGRLRTHCMEAVRQGIHFDQRWLDLAPGFVGDLHLLRDEGCNAAYWSLTDAEVKRTLDGWTVNGQPLRLFHYSGFSPARPEMVTRFAPGMRIDEIGDAADLFRLYAKLLHDAGWTETADEGWPWGGWRHRWKSMVARWRRRDGGAGQPLHC